MSFLNEIKAEDLLWIYRFGRSKRKISTEELLADLSRIEKPVFFLSTGRCGTKWVHNLLSYVPSVRDFHASYPNFSFQNKYVYSLFLNENREKAIAMASQIFLTGREQHLRFAYKCQKRYFETNNHITFFAPALVELMPQAKFVHLYRHPGEFVRSGLRRKWYTENEQANTKLIVPGPMNKEWGTYTQMERIAWLWRETNGFIEDFKEDIAPSQILNFNFNTLSMESLGPLLEFLEIKISRGRLVKLLGKKQNEQRTGSFPVYDNWDEDLKSRLTVICGTLAQKYAYQL